LLFVTEEFKQKRQECFSGGLKCKFPYFKEIMGRFVVEVHGMVHSFLSCSILSVKNSIFQKKKNHSINSLFIVSMKIKIG
jgi:hypothetical protein